MRLITGPLGSGKTNAVLAGFRTSLPAGATLLVPTATMAEHIRNTLLREGLVFPPNAVTTLSKYAGAFASEATVVDTAALELIAGAVLDRIGAFRQVADTPGFRRAVVRAIEELAAAGVAPGDVSGLDIEDFVRIYGAVADEVRRRGWVFGSERLRMAASAIAARPGAPPIFVDGFYSFTPGELAVVEALGIIADTTLTLPLWPGSERTIARLKQAGWKEEPVSRKPAEPRRVLIEASNTHEEVNDIARRILAVHDGGTPFREIGVIIRDEAEYGAALRGVLERFGMPARFYFASDLRTHPTVRYLCGLVQLLLSDWDNELAAGVLRLPDSTLEAAGLGDAFESKLRAGEWTNGFQSVMAAIPQDAAIVEELSALQALRDLRLSASQWAKRIAGLTTVLAAPEIRDGISHEQALRWRERGQALVAFERALESAAAIAEADGLLSLAGFWHVLSTVIDNSQLRVNDHRRDVVHVIDAYEARQWNLPVVFVCGLLEGQFPKHHTEDPILPDRVRRILQARGFQLPTSVDRQRDEVFLFDVATTRASSKLVLTYPRANAKGDDNLRSFVLDKYCRSHAVAAEAAMRIRPQPALDRLPQPRVAIYDDSLHTVLTQSTAVLGPTAIEAYLQCPFRFFVDRTLRLETLAEKPSARMTPRVQGDIVHEAIERVCRTGEKAELALDFVFNKHFAKHHVPKSYRLEAVRLELLYNVRKFFADNKLDMDGYCELEFEVDFALDDLTRVRGRIDRLEFDGDGRPTVIDLKFKAPDKLREDVAAHKAGRLVQGGLYLLAVQQKFRTMPAGMLYCSTRKQIEVRGWIAGGPYRGADSDCTEAQLAEVMEASRKASLDTLVQIRSGHIAPDPYDQDKCEYCSALEVCRWEVQQPATIAGGAV